MKKLFLLILTLATVFSSLLTSCDQVITKTPSPTEVADCEHKDKNRDGRCDLCRIFVTVTLDFFAVNDLHGRFTDSDEQPGVDELSTYFKKQMANGDTVILSSGDMWQGSAESNLTKGLIMTDWMNEIGFSSMTLGNHEFDWGTEYIKENAELAEFPILAINVYDKTTNKLVDYVSPSVMIERKGVKIGIIGAVGDVYSSISADKVEDVYFKTGKELTTLVKQESEKLREAGADIIIYSIHDGYESGTGTGATVSGSFISDYYDISLSEGSVDIVFEGHVHRRYVFKDTRGVYHLQGGAENTGITHAAVAYNLVTGEFSVTSSEYVENSSYSSGITSDPIVNDLVDKYKDDIGDPHAVIGKNDAYRSSDELRALSSKLYCEAGMAKWGEEYQIVLGGGFTSIRKPYELPRGDVTYADILALFPFDNQLVLCEIKGDLLQSRFLFTDNSDYYVTLTDYGLEICNSVDPNATYYIVTDSYNSSYAPNGLKIVETYDSTTFARDLIAEFIKNGGYTSSSSPSYPISTYEKIIADGTALPDGGTSEDEYFFKGTVDSIASTTWGNMYIKDHNGSLLYVYGLYDQNGKRYDAMPQKPQVGDELTVCGRIKNYVDANGSRTIELINAIVFEHKSN